ncbi:MAG: hypothetical protein ABIH23_11920, partial [bacterium]
MITNNIEGGAMITNNIEGGAMITNNIRIVQAGGNLLIGELAPAHVNMTLLCPKAFVIVPNQGFRIAPL